jgi:hypothetical protein
VHPRPKDDYEAVAQIAEGQTIEARTLDSRPPGLASERGSEQRSTR